MNIQEIRDQVASEAQRVALLGNWDIETDLDESVNNRIPQDNKTAPGFDAGIACCLDLVPRDKQRLSAILHANWTPEAVEQILRETTSGAIVHDSETEWWLAACSVCCEGGITVENFIEQLHMFQNLIQDPGVRWVAAQSTLRTMCRTFNLDKGYPFGTDDGCMQGAYLSGHKWATSYNKHYNCFFIGTFLGSLGIPEDFAWEDPDEWMGGEKVHQGNSGKIYPTYYKCASEEELSRVIEVVRAHFA